MDHTTARIDSGAWLSEINEEITRRQYTCDLPSFEDVPIERSEEAIPVEAFSSDILEENLTCMHIGEEIKAFRPLPDAGIKLFVKRILRKLMKFYIEPITRDITDYNRANVLAVAQLRNHAVEQQSAAKKIAELEQTVLSLQQRLAALEAEKKGEEHA